MCTRYFRVRLEIGVRLRFLGIAAPTCYTCSFFSLSGTLNQPRMHAVIYRCAHAYSGWEHGDVDLNTGSPICRIFRAHEKGSPNEGCYDSWGQSGGEAGKTKAN